jgi:hypothetical protein
MGMKLVAGDCNHRSHRASANGWLRQKGNGSICSRALSVARKTLLTVPNNSPWVKGFHRVAASCSHGSRFNSAGIAPDARMTGSAMRAERSFLTSSRPETFGMLLSVIRRS